LHLEVEPTNRSAAALYARHGFTASGRRLLTRPLT
jgi:ribosomal protein S18 acetylase RimI-like enzyme